MYAIVSTKKPLYSIKVWKGKDDLYYFHVTSVNGRIICTSEGYTRKNRATLAAQKLSLNLENALIII